LRIYSIFIIFFCLVFFAVFQACVFADELPFYKGEKLSYDVKYKGLKIGKSILTFHGEEDLKGRGLYHITFYTAIPTLRDTEELYADKKTFLPIEVHRTIKKKIGFGDRIKEIYDQDDFVVRIHQKSKLRSRDFSIEKDSPIHNAILLSYYYRTHDRFSKGDRFKVTLPTIDLDVIFNGIETLDTSIGTYQAYTFTSNPPKFKLWLSSDEKRIPLKIENPGTLGYSLEIKSME